MRARARRSLRTSLTEDRLIAGIVHALGEQPRRLRIGIGDDAAVWKPRRSRLALVTTDALVDGVHFKLDATTPQALGHKALAVNFSDIAAKGGEPIVAVVALGVTAAVDEEWARHFYAGMSTLARRFGCAVAGGDIVAAPALTIAVTVIGEVRPSNLRLRSGAKPGDLACVTGPLGLSALGLEMMRGGSGGSASTNAAQAAYEMPQPRVREGRFLASSRATHAMMDISDGLSLDAWRMAGASKLDICLEVDRIEAARPAALAGRSDWAELMLSGGDDYELLAAVRPRAYAHLARRFKAKFRRDLWVAGRFERGTGRVWEERAGQRREHAPRGYDHFQQNA